MGCDSGTDASKIKLVSVNNYKKKINNYMLENKNSERCIIKYYKNGGKCPFLRFLTKLYVREMERGRICRCLK